MVNLVLGAELGIGVEDGLEARLPVAVHRPELVGVEVAAVFPEALLGVEDLVVVDTPDALLVCPKARAQDVRLIVDELARRRLVRYL